MIIYWDLDETLRENKNLTYQALKQFIDLNASPDEIYWLWDLANLEAIELGEPNVFKIFIKKLSNKLNIEIKNEDEVARGVKDYVHSRIELEKPFPYVKETLENVKDYKNGIISHAKKGSTLNWLKKYKLEEYFDPELIYDGVIDKADYMKGDFIYVGDSITDLYAFLRVKGGYIIMIGERNYNGFKNTLQALYSLKADRIYNVANSLEASKLIRKLFKINSNLN